MKGCRTLREDIVKISTLLKGFSQGKSFDDYLVALTQELSNQPQKSAQDNIKAFNIEQLKNKIKSK